MKTSMRDYKPRSEISRTEKNRPNVYIDYALFMLGSFYSLDFIMFCSILSFETKFLIYLLLFFLVVDISYLKNDIRLLLNVKIINDIPWSLFMLTCFCDTLVL
jgi:hypothetical protein